MLSSDPDFQQLLLLHSRDKIKNPKKRLDKLPGELEYMDKKIFEEKESIRMAMEEWKT